MEGNNELWYPSLLPSSFPPSLLPFFSFPLSLCPFPASLLPFFNFPERSCCGNFADYLAQALTKEKEQKEETEPLDETK
jgi:hypothetical protein